MKKVGSPLEIGLVIIAFFLIVFMAVTLTSMITKKDQVVLEATVLPVKTSISIVPETVVSTSNIETRETIITPSAGFINNIQDQDIQEYLKVAGENIIISRNVFLEVADLMSSRNIDVDNPDWQAKIAGASVKMGVVHNEFVAITSIPSSMSDIHNLLVDSTNDCHNSLLDLSVGYITKSEDYLNKAIPLMESCMQKWKTAMQLLARGIGTTPEADLPSIDIVELSPTLASSSPTALPVEPTPYVSDSNLIIDVKIILGKSIDEVEKVLGEGKYPTPFQAGSLSNFSGAGETRYYQINKYAFTISYDIEGMAKGFQIIEGLEDDNYAVTQWNEILPRFNINIDIPPDTNAPAAKRWKNLDGYKVEIAARNKSGSPVWTIQIWQPETN